MQIIVENSCGLKLLEGIRIRKVLPIVRGRLLDIGCGCNNLVKNYKRIYHGKGVGIDVFAWPGVDKVVVNSSKLTFDDNSFDTITFLANLNHIPYREEVLKEAERLLKPGGLLIITMISKIIGEMWHKFPERLWGEREKGRSFEEGEMGGINSEQMIGLIKNAGFIKISRDRFSLFNNIYTAYKP